MSKLQSLLEAVADKKPHDFKEVFDDVMVEKMRAVVDEYRDVVAESMFVEAEEEEEISEDDEEDESVEEYLDEAPRLSPWDAKKILDKHDAHGDFHALHSSKVEGLLGDAKAAKYRKGKGAPGSTGRMFHAHLSRLAGRLNKKEEEQIDEISKKTLASYEKKSAEQEGIYGMKSWRDAKRGETNDKNFRKWTNRTLGGDKAREKQGKPPRSEKEDRALYSKYKKFAEEEQGK